MLINGCEFSPGLQLPRLPSCLLTQCCQIFLEGLRKPLHQPLPGVLPLHNFFFLDPAVMQQDLSATAGNAEAELSGNPL